MLAACGSSSSSSSSSSGSSGGGASTGSSTGSASGGSKKAKIAAFLVDTANPYDTVLGGSEKSEAKKLGASITVFGANNSPSTQVGQCQDALASNQYNVFLLKAVVGPPLLPCARQAIQQGIKVVAVDDPLGAKYTIAPQLPGLSASIISLPTTNGTALANLTVGACAGKNPCQVAYFFGPPAFVFASESRAQFNSEIAKHSNIKVIDEASSNFQSSLGTSLTQQLLTTHPGVNVITSDSDQTVLGSLKALKSAGKTGTVKLVGGGGSCPGADAIKSGSPVRHLRAVPGDPGRDLGAGWRQGAQRAADRQTAAQRRLPVPARPPDHQEQYREVQVRVGHRHGGGILISSRDRCHHPRRELFARAGWSAA